MQQLCKIWRIKARQILFIVKQKYFASRFGRFEKEEECRGEGKRKPEGDGENLWGLCLERFVRRSNKTEKAPSARAKQIPQNTIDKTSS